MTVLTFVIIFGICFLPLHIFMLWFYYWWVAALIYILQWKWKYFPPFFVALTFMQLFYCSPTSQEDYNYFWHVLRIVGFCLSFVNSCANPVTLYFLSGTFRKHFNRWTMPEKSLRFHWSASNSLLLALDRFLCCSNAYNAPPKRTETISMHQHNTSIMTSLNSSKQYSGTRKYDSFLFHRNASRR